MDPDRRTHSVRPRLRSYALAMAFMAAFGLWRLGGAPDEGAGAGPLVQSLLALKIGIELLAAFFIAVTLLKCAEYGLLPARPAPPGNAGAPPEGAAPSVAVIYLCAGDLDETALRSLLRLQHDGPLQLVVHDDTADPAEAKRISGRVRALAEEEGREVALLRRDRRSGGKPGAVNHVLSRLGARHDFVLLCDNDSVALDADAVRRGLRHFDDPRTGAVQFRNVGLAGEDDGAAARILARAVDVFDVFASHHAQQGFMPFMGHNGMLRVAALHEVGGFREGYLSDDVDLSLRLMHAGWRIRYAPEVTFGERHPPSYDAFRRRARKWAFGCGQVLKRHTLATLRSPRLPLATKVGFLDFAGFYLVQVGLVVYLGLVCAVLPWLLPQSHGSTIAALCGGAFVLASVFLPALTWFGRHRSLREAWPFSWVCALVYGSVGLQAARGVLGGLFRKSLHWMPTNVERKRDLRQRLSLLPEAAFGLGVAATPLIAPVDPLPYLALGVFALVYLSAPALELAYQPRRVVARGGGRSVIARGALRRGSARPLVLAASVALPTLLALTGDGCSRAGAHADAAEGVTLSDEEFLVDGESFPVRGVHYGPWRPGTGPAKDYSWPGAALVREDLGMIRDLGANTVVVHEPPAAFLDLAGEHGLMVIAAFWINWQSIEEEESFAKRVEAIAGDVSAMAGHEQLLAVLIGNEVLEWVHAQAGPGTITARLRTAYDAVKEVAPGIPVSHANWPVTKELPLDFLDFAAFNLYPSWPREVVVRGYGDYVEEVLLPIAGDRPLLISEFGQNSLEASEEKQAEVLRACWEEIRGRTAGGVVFSFADEWWKNYDNPVSGEDWWEREHAPDDELTHDLDPEEHYGIYTHARQPKPAAAAVASMYGARGSSGPGWRSWAFGAPLIALAAYTAFLLMRLRRESRELRPETSDRS